MLSEEEGTLEEATALKWGCGLRSVVFLALCVHFVLNELAPATGMALKSCQVPLQAADWRHKSVKWC